MGEKGPTGPIGERGALGMCGGGCPRCGSFQIKWDPASDVSFCLECGWDNREEAEENRLMRIANGEIPAPWDESKKLNILGTEYTITVKKYDEDETFERRSIDGYCDDRTKQIVVCDMSTYKGWEYEPKETIAETQKEAIRHEIVHAFLSESGLCDSSLSPECAWAKNEEMVDWIALQGPKIFKAWQEAGAV